MFKNPLYLGVLIYFSMRLRQPNSSRWGSSLFYSPPAVLKKANALSHCSLSDKTAMWLNGEREGLERRQKWALLERRRRRLGSGWGTIGTQEGDVKGNGSKIKRGFRRTPISRIKIRSNGSEIRVQQSAICFYMHSLDIDVGTHVHILQLTLLHPSSVLRHATRLAKNIDDCWPQQGQLLIWIGSFE